MRGEQGRGGGVVDTHLHPLIQVGHAWCKPMGKGIVRIVPFSVGCPSSRHLQIYTCMVV